MPWNLTITVSLEACVLLYEAIGPWTSVEWLSTLSMKLVRGVPNEQHHYHPCVFHEDTICNIFVTSNSCKNAFFSGESRNIYDSMY